ncbi:MAG: hypothetical protein GC190_08465 [Alphaproteobacteria bacterium]|nr:hypothetical protein [Alphaproteobacteria bacterium]
MRYCALLLVAIALAGCQTVNSTWSSITSSGSSSTAEPSADTGQTAMVAPATSTGTPSSLKGQTSDSLHALWGEPSLKRKDLGSELWQYAGQGCTLLIYLYPSAGGTMTVSHAEAVPGGSDDAAIDACAKAAGKPPIKPMS